MAAFGHGVKSTHPHRIALHSCIPLAWHGIHGAKDACFPSKTQVKGELIANIWFPIVYLMPYPRRSAGSSIMRCTQTEAADGD